MVMVICVFSERVYTATGPLFYLTWGVHRKNSAPFQQKCLEKILVALGVHLHPLHPYLAAPILLVLMRSAVTSRLFWVLRHSRPKSSVEIHVIT